MAISEIVHFYYRYILISKDNSHYSLSNDEKINLLPKEFKNKIFHGLKLTSLKVDGGALVKRLSLIMYCLLAIKEK